MKWWDTWLVWGMKHEPHIVGLSNGPLHSDMSFSCSPSPALDSCLTNWLINWDWEDGERIPARRSFSTGHMVQQKTCIVIPPPMCDWTQMFTRHYKYDLILWARENLDEIHLVHSSVTWKDSWVGSDYYNIKLKEYKVLSFLALNLILRNCLNPLLEGAFVLSPCAALPPPAEIKYQALLL